MNGVDDDAHLVHHGGNPVLVDGDQGQFDTLQRRFLKNGKRSDDVKTFPCVQDRVLHHQIETSIMWVDGHSSSIFLLVKMSRPMMRILACPCLPGALV